MKRKDKNKKPRYQALETWENIDADQPSLGESLLLWVEGETEAAYFEKLKQNIWMANRLAGVRVEVVGDLGAALKKIKDAKEEPDWIVADNDKQNAFILEEKGHPFFENLGDSQIPSQIRDLLAEAYQQDWHNYFLCIHDYLQWLKSVLGPDQAIEYWDRIQFFTPHKERLLDVFDSKYLKNPESKIQLAYSCVAFEFWLLLHFEQNKTPFLWVNQGKSVEVDVIECLKTFRRDYEKGSHSEKSNIEKPCNAYTCLYDDYTKAFPTRNDDWRVLTRMFTACQNAHWLRNEMQPMLDRQSGKWYEVNPYVLGIDTLMAKLLNIKPLGESIDYFGLTLQFHFDPQLMHLMLQIAVNDGEGFEMSNPSCFMIRNAEGQSFVPNPFDFELPNANTPLTIKYEENRPVGDLLVLVFKDPRARAKSSQMFIILN
jgi:hypothetical protein